MLRTSIDFAYRRIFEKCRKESGRFLKKNSKTTFHIFKHLV